MTLKTLIPASKPVRLMAAALVVALAGTAATFVQAQPMGGHGGLHGGPGAMFGGRMMERMLDGVDATADQRSRIRDIMKSAMTDMRQQHEASRALRDQAVALFTQPTVDARAAEALRQQMLQQHDQASRRTMQAMLDASAVLTPEQRTKLAERMKQRRETMERHQRERRATGTPKS
jgi:Spy/CpxP family protein refolding chaperone